MATSKLKGFWGCKIEALGGLESWGRKTEGQASFGVDLGSVWGDSGGILGRFGRVRGGPGKAREKFSKNRCFDNQCTVCSLKRRIRWSGSSPKINFDKNSVPAGPARTGLVVSRTPLYVTHRKGPALYVVTDFPFYGFLRRGPPGWAYEWPPWRRPTTLGCMHQI